MIQGTKAETQPSQSERNYHCPTAAESDTQN
jgi:hypothetical protein